MYSLKNKKAILFTYSQNYGYYDENLLGIEYMVIKMCVYRLYEI